MVASASDGAIAFRYSGQHTERLHELATAPLEVYRMEARLHHPRSAPLSPPYNPYLCLDIGVRLI